MHCASHTPGSRHPVVCSSRAADADRTVNGCTASAAYSARRAPHVPAHEQPSSNAEFALYALAFGSAKQPGSRHVPSSTL
ncbi:hypothetical protein OAO87_04330 [bacterium]|nr:hypothetical protein [bacterium]